MNNFLNFIYLIKLYFNQIFNQLKIQRLAEPEMKTSQFTQIPLSKFELNSKKSKIIDILVTTQPK